MSLAMWKQITILGKKVIMLEGDIEYLVNALSKKDMDLEMFHDNVQNLGYFDRFLKVSLYEKEDLSMGKK